MATNFIKFIEGIIRTPRRLLVTSVLPVVFLAFGLTNCSGEGVFSSEINANVTPLLTPVSIAYNPPATLNLEGSSGGLHLNSTATDIWIDVAACNSGYTFTATAAIPNAFVRLYKTDLGCIAKLRKFTFQSKIYSATATGATDLSEANWDVAGSVAVFANESDSTDVINVFVEDPIDGDNTGGVEASEVIQFSFTDIAEGTASSVSESEASTSATLTVQGQDTPEFRLVQSRYLSTTSGGAGEMSFTLECFDDDGAGGGSGITITGTTATDWACNGDLMDAQHDILDYLLFPDSDLAATGAPTIDELNDLFDTTYSGSVREIAGTAGAAIVEAGNDDLHSNTLTFGGFYTSDSSPIETQGGAIYPSNLDHILAVRLKDSSGNTLSYLFFDVSIASITQN